MFKNILFQWGPVVIWAGLIFYFSSQPTVPGSSKFMWDFFLKKTAHMIGYGIFYYLLVRAVKPKSLSAYVVIMIFCVFYAISDEIHQSFVPGRTATLMDVGFDSLGASISFSKIKNVI